MSARLKLERAITHLEAFASAWEEFTSAVDPSDFYRFEMNDERTSLTYYLEERPLPRELGLFIGDCVTNMRAALDHLAFALPREPNADARWERWSQFPIYELAHNDPSSKARGYWDHVGRRDLHGVDPQAIDRCEGLQPYFGGGDVTIHPLHVLQVLSNLDKHRLIHVVTLVPQEASLQSTDPPNGTVWGVLANGELDPGSVLGRLYFSDPVPPETVDVTLSVRFGVTIGGIEPVWGVEYALDGIHGYITDQVLPAMEPFIA